MAGRGDRGKRARDLAAGTRRGGGLPTARPESKETAYEPGSGAQLVDDGPAAAEDGDEHGTETEAPARARRAARRARGRQAGTSQRRQRGAQALVVGMAAALAVAAVVNREAVVRAVPSTAGLFRTLGMPVNLRGLDFDTVTLHRVFEDGLSVLIVNGQIVNLRDAEIPVPALRFALRGGTGEELYTWVVEPRQAMLEPRGTMSFRSRLAAPPHGAQDVEVRFVDRTGQSAGMQP